MLSVIQLPESTYHYYHSKRDNPHSDKNLEDLMTDIFNNHQGTYGYRRITMVLRAKGYVINHKKVQRMMRKLGLKCTKFSRRSRRFNAYEGTVGKVAKNRLRRRFSTSVPLQKLATDITEFKCTENEKLYLSPIMDLYNREIISYKISKRPTLDIALDPLDEALEMIKERALYRTTIHSDQGFHYQNWQWTDKLKDNKIYQSMSCKGNCLDNAAMENFFGLLKQEMYYGEERVSFDELEKRINNYIHYYNHKRVKQKLSGLSPVDYRKQDTQYVA